MEFCMAAGRQGAVNEAQQDSAGSELNLFEILAFLQKHAKTLVLFLSLGILAGLALWYITPPKFKSQVRLKMSHNSRDVIGFGQDFYWNPYREEFFKTEFQIIRSLPVALRVVDRLGMAELAEQVGDQREQPAENLAELAMQARQTEEDKGDAGAERRKNVALSLLAGVAVSEVKGTNLVSISYTSGDADRAQNLAQAWAEAYIAHDIDNNYKKNFEAYTFLTNKAEELRNKIEKIVKEVAGDEATSEIVALGKTTNVDDATLSGLNTAKLVAEKSLAEAQSSYQRLLTTPLDQNEEINASPVVQELLAELSKLRTAYQTDLKTFKPQLPRMVASRNSIESKEKTLEAERKRALENLMTTRKADIAGAEREVLRSQAAFESARKKVSETRLMAQSETESLQSQLKVMKHQLEVLEYKKEEMDLAMSLKDLGRSDKVVIEDANRPGAPFAPSIKRFTLLGGMCGLVLAIALVFLFEVTDRKIHSSETLEKLSGLPTLATIPKAPDMAKGTDAMEARKQVGFQTHLHPTSPFAETYRHLRTNILLSKAAENRVFLVTSSVSGEGKTISSANLAIALAQLEKRVLLVDCDLRRPKLHKLFNLANKLGLVNLLVSSEGPKGFGLATLVPNLYLLPSGPLPPNPAELVSSPRMAELVSQLRSSFDYIVIDSSPILAVTDACLLGRLADTVLFVAKASTTLREDYVRSMQLLKQNGIRPLGTIFNDFDYSKGRRYYGYRYGYGRYGRHYGYSPYDYKAEET
jgi:capsular exopolysaccharide synthesis family protein